MELSENARLIESVLFLENNPVTVEYLGRITGIDELEVIRLLDEISELYYKENHGIVLVESSETFKFVPSSNLYERLRECYGKKVDKRITKSAMETLAIVAYQQPITRSEISKIRGVDSDNIVRVLRERDYIKVVGRKDVQGHPCLYGTTKKFLYSFKLNSISDLPKLSDIDKLRFEKDENEN